MFRKETMPHQYIVFINKNTSVFFLSYTSHLCYDNLKFHKTLRGASGRWRLFAWVFLLCVRGPHPACRHATAPLKQWSEIPIFEVRIESDVDREDLWTFQVKVPFHTFLFIFLRKQITGRVWRKRQRRFCFRVMLSIEVMATQCIFLRRRCNLPFVLFSTRRSPEIEKGGSTSEAERNREMV